MVTSIPLPFSNRNIFLEKKLKIGFLISFLSFLSGSLGVITVLFTELKNQGGKKKGGFFCVLKKGQTFLIIR